MACDDFNSTSACYRLPSIPASEVLRAASGAFDLIDVRKTAAREKDGRDLAGARWVEPFTLRFEHPVLSGSRPLVFFCVQGHEVSQFAAALALVAGVEARYVEGGFAALVAAGARLLPRCPALGGIDQEGRP
ncbi:rhodanese-like domain-containing protein [Halovulum sp. GXIMD14794]